MPNKFLQLIAIMRLNAPIGYLLVFFPTVFGLLLALKDLKKLVLIPLFFIGSVLSRAAGCIINDIFDYKIDAKVERTKNRPIASGNMTIKEALIVTGLLLVGCLHILISLSITSITLGIIAFFMILVYPLMKRFTNFPQFFLGATFNLGVLIAYAALDDQINQEAIVLYTACCFWTIGYDTIYAFIDIRDDKKVGVKSTAIFFEKKFYKLFIISCYFLFILLFTIANIMSTKYFFPIFGVIISFIILSWQVMTLEINNPDTCLLRFKSNQYVGLILSFSMLLEHLL